MKYYFLKFMMMHKKKLFCPYSFSSETAWKGVPDTDSSHGRKLLISMNPNLLCSLRKMFFWSFNSLHPFLHVSPITCQGCAGNTPEFYSILCRSPTEPWGPAASPGSAGRDGLSVLGCPKGRDWNRRFEPPPGIAPGGWALPAHLFDWLSWQQQH